MALPVFTTTANQPEVVVDGVQGKMRDVTCYRRWAGTYDNNEASTNELITKADNAVSKMLEVVGCGRIGDGR